MRPVGLIPAHAGKTTRRQSTARPSPAHPRSRGENDVRVVSRARIWGSSPLTRGKHIQRPCTPHGGGLIPAHAGKTPGDPLNNYGQRAHPRSRGENGTSGGDPAFAGGSSPLTRGKPGGRVSRSGKAGLIPAHAGKTGDCDRSPGALGAHPRSRGENQYPRVRRRLSMGLIPAHAGKTGACRSRLFRCWAHPRSRGENSELRGRVPRIGGSSPLTRGKHEIVVNDGWYCGLIPAHAGKTLPDLCFYRADRSDLGKP